MHWEVARMYIEPKFADPADMCFFCDGTPHITCHECKVLHCTLHLSICQSEICVGLRLTYAANLGVVVAAAFAVVAAMDANNHPCVWICGKWYAVPPQ